MTERLQNETSFNSSEIISNSGSERQYYNSDFEAISRSEYLEGYKTNSAFMIPKMDIEPMRQKMHQADIIKQYTVLKSLFAQTSLFEEYFRSESLQNSFFQRVFFGLLASESAFGTLTTVQKEATNKGLYQITGTSLKDAPNARKYQTLWPYQVAPQRRHITDLRYSARLCVLNFERIYEITKPLLSSFDDSSKAELILPIFIIAYNQGGGAAKSVIKQVLKYKEDHNRFPSRTEMLQNALKAKHYQPGHLTYFFKIWHYSEQLRTDEQSIAQESLSYQQSSQARQQLSAQVRQQNPQPRAEIENQRRIDLDTLFAPSNRNNPTRRLTKQQQVEQMYREVEQMQREVRELQVAVDTLLQEQQIQGQETKQVEQTTQAEILTPITWADVIQEGSLDNLSETKLLYFVIDTFMPQRDTQTQDDGTIVHTDTYPFNIIVTTEIKDRTKTQTIYTTNTNIKSELLQTPIGQYPKRPPNLDSSFDVS